MKRDRKAMKIYDYNGKKIFVATACGKRGLFSAYGKRI